MPTVVVPFRGTEGKSRLAGLPLEARAVLREAMLADVLAACEAVGSTYLVTSAPGVATTATVVPDEARGQGAAVVAGLEFARRAGAAPPYLVVNADLPCVTSRDLLALAGAIPDDGLSLVAAADGTTNALALFSPELFQPLYGPGSAARFAELGPSRRLALPNLIDDVDTVVDLERLAGRLGRRTRHALARVQAGALA